MRKVLVVDDEEVYCRYLSHAFGGRGYEVRTAPGGREALETAKWFIPDVLIVDWKLKDKYDGLHVVQEMKSHCPELVSILMTGFMADALKEELRGSDIFRCIQKPFDLTDMLQAVEAALTKGSA